MAMLINTGGAGQAISLEQQRRAIKDMVAALDPAPAKVLLVPPDYTRLQSGAGALTAMLYELLSVSAYVDVMPALGTHVAMTEDQIRTMFGSGIPLDRFLVHDWRATVTRFGEIPAERVRQESGGKLHFSIDVEMDRVLTEGVYDLVFSVGQVVPHEVMGMANYTKNLCIGLGGQDIINKTHFLSAVAGVDNIIGTADNPVRRLINEAYTRFLGHLRVIFVLTVMESGGDEAGTMRGLFVGPDEDAFLAACTLSREVNITFVDEPLDKVVVYLSPGEYRSTWLGNKSIYRTRPAIADGGELIVLAPGLETFCEDPAMDKLLRRYGYIDTEATMAAVEEDEELRANYGLAAHFIHSTADGRFSITYCTGDHMTAAEVEGIGFRSANLSEMLKRYPPETMAEGMNDLGAGDPVYFVRHPGQGLWLVGGSRPNA